ncbi:hypothetical protein E1264_35905 [Actinomadura sp. KC216]|nr:hypothetical protein E1264_35905 [Actinomadura sp. KC216]
MGTCGTSTADLADEPPIPRRRRGIGTRPGLCPPRSRPTPRRASPAPRPRPRCRRPPRWRTPTAAGRGTRTPLSRTAPRTASPSA